MKELHTKKINRFLRPTILAFIVPVVILLLLYIIRGIFPFGDRIYVRMDFYHQYAPFVKEFINRIRDGESILYAWEYGLGTNYWAHYAYYLASPWNLLLLLLPVDYVVEAMNVTMVLRAGISGAAFVFFLKEERKEKLSMAAFGIFYALSGYYIAYSCNIIWMDGFALFPLVALGVSRIAKGKSAFLYTVSMLICTFSNFYLAVIMGMCCVVWLLICLISGKRKKIKDVLVAGLRFTGYTVLYVAMCAVILLPVAYALGNTPAGESTFPQTPEFYFAFYELLEQMCLNASTVLKGSELPNIYASVLALTMLPLFFCNKTIRLKEKIVYGIVLLFMLVSFQFNMLDYIWHGLHFPNSFPARQSFFLIFLMLTVGYKAFERRKRLSGNVLVVVIPVFMILLGAAWVFLGKDNDYSGMHIYLCTMIFVLIYGILLYFEKYLPKKMFLWMFIGVCCLEAGINTCVTGMNSVVNRAAYMNDDVQTEAVLEEILPEDNAFYRVEELDRRFVNEAAWDDYPGASYFSSTMPGGVNEWYDAFGMRTSSVSYSYAGATPLVSSLLGIKYVFACEEEYLPGNTFVETKIPVGEESAFIYENETVLPLGYMVPDELADSFVYDFSNPFVTQNRFAQAVLGEQVALFKKVIQFEEYSLPSFDVGAGAESSMEEEEDEKYICLNISAGENVFLYVTTYMEAIEVNITDMETGEIETLKFSDLKFKRVLSLGVSDNDRKVSITSADDSVSEIKLYAYKMNEDVLQAVCNRLGEQPMEITEVDETRLSGEINVTEAGTLLLSIPYDEGWSIKADGEAVETFAWKDAFLAIHLEEGMHELEFSYCPVWFKEGLIISIVGIFAFMLTFTLLNKSKRKGRNASVKGL